MPPLDALPSKLDGCETAEAVPQDVMDYALEEILTKRNPYAYSTLTAIQRTLRQYQLSPRIEAYEVLNEAYLRGKKYLQTGKDIRNPHAWLKATAFRVVCERRRKLVAGLLEPHLIDALEPDEGMNPLQRQILEEDYSTLNQALHQLREEEPEATYLLYLRTLEEWSWAEIRARLLAIHQQAPSEATLRQRGSRAKKRLRQIFIEMTESPVSITPLR